MVIFSPKLTTKHKPAGQNPIQSIPTEYHTIIWQSKFKQLLNLIEELQKAVGKKMG